jgi:hypothetical protein
VTLAHPWFLLGLLAAFIPLLVHLFDRRQPRPLPFAALAFVLRSQKRTASRLRLRRLLLYALRTMVFIALPLALAQPSCVQPGAATSRPGLAATALVVDRSLGLKYESGKPIFELARREALAAVAESAPEEPVALVPCGKADVTVTPLSFEKVRLREAIDALTPSLEVADLNRCLELAVRALDDSPLPNRRVVVVSPFFESTLHLEVPPAQGKAHTGEPLKPEVVVRRVASDEALPNRALIEAHAEPAAQVAPRAWQLSFTVRNFSAEAASNVGLSLKVDGQVVTRGFVDVPANGTAVKVLTHKFEKAGLVEVEGVLEPDGLRDDDVRSVLVMVPKEVRALVVNGAPSPQKYKDEAYFVEAALSAVGSPARPVLRDAEAAWREDFSAFQAIALLNVEAPPAEVVTRLNAFVSAGGGLFVSVGENVDPAAYNQRLGAMLPRPLRVVKTAAEPSSPEAATQAAKLTQWSATHPVMSPFVGPAKEGLMATRFFRYALFEADTNGIEAVASLDDGAPVLLAQTLAQGKVLLFGSTVDRDWCDAPVRTAFLPLMQRAMAWLTGSLDEREALTATVGALVTLPPVAAVKGPGGLEVSMAPTTGGVTVGPLPIPGVYRPSVASGPADALAFVASLDARGSDLSRLSPEAVSAWFGNEVVRLAGVGVTQGATPVWTWLLLFVAIAFLAEGLLLRRP